MTELAISQPRTITPLAALSASTPKPAPLAEYHGVQTPAALEPLEQELAALALGAAVHDLGWLRRTAVRGEDTEERAAMQPVSIAKNGLIKVAPLLKWSSKDMHEYCKKHGLPNNFDYFDPTKIEDNRECGLHTVS